MEVEFIDVVIELLLGVAIFIPLWVIFRKAGFHPALSLLFFIPILGLLITTMILAFGEWKTVEEKS